MVVFVFIILACVLLLFSSVFFIVSYFSCKTLHVDGNYNHMNIITGTRTVSSENKNLTIIICNYMRPHNIRHTLKEFSQTLPAIVTEIIISHGNPLTYEKFTIAREDIAIKNIKQYANNKLYGGTQRFFSAKYASNKYILFLDDDHIPDASFILTLYKAVQEDKNQIYGPYIRSCSSRGYYNLSKSQRQYYNMIITPILMTSKEVVLSYLNNFFKYKTFLASTHGNAEDLSFNHNFITMYRKKPVAIEGKYRALDEQTVSYRGKKCHLRQRQTFCKLYMSTKSTKMPFMSQFSSNLKSM